MRLLTTKKILLTGFSMVIILSLITLSTNAQDNKEVSLPVFNQESVLVRSHITTVDIYQPSLISIKESFVIENTELVNLTFVDLWFNSSLNTLIVEDGEGILNYDWQVVTNSSNLVRVNLRSEIEQNETATFIVKYLLSTSLTLLGSDSSYYSFEFYSTITHPTNSYKMIIYLPERSFMHYFSDSTPSLYPSNSTQILELNRIKITWIFADFVKGENPFFLVRFDEPFYPEESLTFWEKGSTMFLFGFLSGVFIGIAGISWLIRYREKKAMKKIGMTLLTDNQKDLIKIIYDRNGKVSQKELCDVTGFSKSKISRNLVPLELRGLIKREKWGRTYVIYLTDDGRTVIE